MVGEGFPGQASTQRRHLEISGRLLGLSGDTRQGERIADLLELSGIEHHQAREQWSSAGTRRERGAVIVSQLVALCPDRDDRLLAAGHVAGVWARPWRIDPQTGRRRAVPLRDPPTSFAVPGGERPS